MSFKIFITILKIRLYFAYWNLRLWLERLAGEEDRKMEQFMRSVKYE